MKSSVRTWMVAASLATLVLAAGALIGVIVADDSGEVAALRARLDDLEDRAATLAANLDRLRAERNRLEARLAAGRDTPICPERFTSTRAGGLPLPFSVDHPCGWHVVHDALGRADPEGRGDLSVQVTLFAQLPVALVPRAGTLADIELTDWSADPGADAEMPTMARWLEQERSSFAEPPDEDRFEGAGGITIHRLDGALDLGDDRAQVLVLVWSYTHPLTGQRHIVRAFAAEPGPRVTSVLERMARSFVVLTR